MVLLRKRLLPAATALGVAALAALAALAGACSSGQAPIASGDAGSASESGAAVFNVKCTTGGLTIAFNPMYSAYDGKHTFQIPAVVVGSKSPVTWFADSTLVGMQADNERSNEVLITMLKAGSTTIHVQSKDGKCGFAPLTISPALESDWEIGNARYNDGVSAHLSGTVQTGTGSPLEVQLDGGGPACTNCHGETATGGAFTNVSHTPEQTGGFSDQELVALVTKGIWPAHDTFDSNIVMQGAWMNFHRWADITPDQQRGIVVYLRSLTPAPQKGAKNFGAFDMDSGPAMVVVEAAAPDDGGSADGDAGAGEASATD